MKKIEVGKTKKIIREIPLFIAKHILQFSLLLLLIALNLVYFVAGAIGFLSGAVSGFILNRLWTFKSNVPIAAGFLRYFIIQLFCLGAHITTQIGVAELLGVPEILSQLAGITITTFMNFFISRAIVFKK